MITPNQSFIALGGDSLKALQVSLELLLFNYVTEMGDLLRAETLTTAASLLKIPSLTQPDQGWNCR